METNSPKPDLGLACANMVFTGGLAFEIVEDPLITFITKTLSPKNFEVPTAEELSTYFLGICYRKVLSSVSASISNLAYLSISVDYWTGSHKKDYASVTIHGVDKTTFKFTTQFLGVIPVVHIPNVDKANAMLQSLLRRAGVDQSKIIAVVSDGPVPPVAKLLNTISVPSSLRFLYDLRKNCMIKVSTSNPLLLFLLEAAERLTELSERYGNAPWIKQAPGGPKTPLEFLINIVDHEELIRQLVMKTGSHDPFTKVLSMNEDILWPLIKQTLKVLRKIDKLMDSLCDDSRPTLHLVIRNFLIFKWKMLEMKQSLEHDSLGAQLVDVILESLPTKLENFDDHELMAFALNPSHYISELESRKEWNAFLEEGYNLLGIHIGYLKEANIDPQDGYQTSGSLKIERLLGRAKPAEDELKQYKTLVSPSLTFDDPLEFWLANRSTYPYLSHLAIKILAVPASHAPSSKLAALMRGLPNRNPTYDHEVMHRLFTVCAHNRIQEIKDLEAKKQAAANDKSCAIKELAEQAEEQSEEQSDEQSEEQDDGNLRHYYIEDRVIELRQITEDDFSSDEDCDICTKSDVDDDEESDEDEESDDYVEWVPPTKNAKRRKPIFESFCGLDGFFTPLNSCLEGIYDGSLIYGFFPYGSESPSFEAVFGENMEYFQDFRLLSPPELCLYSFRLSDVGHGLCGTKGRSLNRLRIKRIRITGEQVYF